MSEPTGTDADDGLDRAVTQREGALRDELHSRHLAYQRALERHRRALEAETVAVMASAYVPEQYRATAALAHAWRNLREARDLLEAARDALLRHRSQ